MTTYTEQGHAPLTAALFPALQPDEHGDLPPAGQRFVRQIAEWAAEAAEAEQDRETAQAA